MKLLFTIDKKDYAEGGNVYSRPSSRAIIKMQGKIAMCYLTERGYYKFPGGGIEEGETPVQALIREVKEEAGLALIPSSIKEFGYVHRVQKGRIADIFVQDSYYYLASAEEGISAPSLDEYEEELGFVLELVTPEAAIRDNLEAEAKLTDPFEKVEAERERRVLELLKEERKINRFPRKRQ